MNSANVQLEWALVAGRLAHISEFRHALPRLRPVALCESCGGELSMKLGTIRAHHYSHRSNNGCRLTAPETARHYNTKQLLASQLRSADALRVVTKCAFSSNRVRCTADLTSVAAEEWDEVRVEPFIDPIRPDILLLKTGVAMLAIEVRATHAVPETKATRLADLGIPWIEVVAGTECNEWMPGVAMPALRYESKSAPEFCSAHLDRDHSDLAAPTNVAYPSASRTPTRTARSHGDRWQFRVVDCHPNHGPRRRKVFWVYCTRLNSLTCHLRVVDDSTSLVVAELGNATKSDQSLKEVHDLLVKYLRRTYERHHSPIKWQDNIAFPKNPATIYRTDFMPVKYCRDSNGVWRTAAERADV